MVDCEIAASWPDVIVGEVVARHGVFVSGDGLELSGICSAGTSQEVLRTQLRSGGRGECSESEQS